MDRFYRICAATPAAAPGDFAGNLKALKKCYLDAAKQGAAIVVFPEYAVCGDRCGALACRADFLGACRNATEEFAASTGNCIAVFGTLWQHNGQTVSAAVVARNGRIFSVIPATAPEKSLCFDAGFSFAVAVGEIGRKTCEADALLVLGSEAFTSGAFSRRETLFTGYSALHRNVVVFANAGGGIPNTDHVGDGDVLIAGDGKILTRGEFFASPNRVFADVDFGRIAFCRRSRTPDAEIISLGNAAISPDLAFASIPREPFFEEAGNDLPQIVAGAVAALATRMKQCGAQTLVLGVSGGLDSTLALLVCARVCDQLELPRECVQALTLPGFGTSGRTHSNAQKLCENLGIPLKEIDISDACMRHLEAIGHDGKSADAVFENAQARERTQILMDYANLKNGIVIGTGDLSELALGWCTYNADQMSMYNVNASIPKTLIRRILSAEAQNAGGSLAAVLEDVIATPVSPELLPLEQGETQSAQETEAILGPYELHDFFLYHYVTGGAGEEKLFHLARRAFGDVFTEDVIRKTLQTFMRRLFSQQFKRDPSPDAPQLTSVSLSPRTGWHIPTGVVR